MSNKEKQIRTRALHVLYCAGVIDRSRGRITTINVDKLLALTDAIISSNDLAALMTFRSEAYITKVRKDSSEYLERCYLIGRDEVVTTSRPH